MGEEKKPEEENKPKEEEQKKEGEAPAAEAAAPPPPPPPPPPPEEVEMRVFMHCEGCARKVRRSLKGFVGVEEVRTDCRTHKVVVKGKKAAGDPVKVVERVQKKTGRRVELLSPLPPPLEEKKKEEEEKPKAEEKKEEPVVIAVVLMVHMHCEACSQEIKKRILRMEGVQSAESDLKASHVTVKGVFDPPKLVEYIHKRTNKHATIIKAEPVNKKPEGGKAKEEEREKDEKKEDNKAEGEKKEDKNVEGGEDKANKEEEKKTEDKKVDDKAEGDKAEKEENNDAKDKKELSPEEMAAAAAVAAAVAAAAKMEQKRNEFYYYYPTIPRYPVEYAAGYSAYPQYQHQVAYAHPQLLPQPQGTAYAPQIFSDENPNACSVM